MVCVLTEKELRALHHLAQRLESQGLIAESRELLDLLRVGGDRREVRASVAARILRVTLRTIRN